MEAAKADLNKFLLTGVSRGLAFNTSELQGMLTLNGDFSAGIGTGVTNGLPLTLRLQLPRPDTVQNVAKSSSYFHYNQFQDIGTWSGEGMNKLRKAYRQCLALRAGRNCKGPDNDFHGR